MPAIGLAVGPNVADAILRDLTVRATRNSTVRAW
jgi:hypothetical protein